MRESPWAGGIADECGAQRTHPFLSACISYFPTSTCTCIDVTAVAQGSRCSAVGVRAATAAAARPRAMRLLPRQSAAAALLRVHAWALLLVLCAATTGGSQACEAESSAAPGVPAACDAALAFVEARAGPAGLTPHLVCAVLAGRDAPVGLYARRTQTAEHAYVHAFRDLLTDVAHHGQLAGVVLVAAADDGTLPRDVEAGLQAMNVPFLSHARVPCDARHVILIPDPHYITSRGFASARVDAAVATPLSERAPTVFWRGASTGPCPADVAAGDADACCDRLLRVALCRAASNVTWLDAKLTQRVQYCAAAAADAAVAGLLAAFVPERDWAAHRGLVDVDGNTNSWGLFWRLLSGSVLFRVESDDCTLYLREMQPWVHYVPVSPDLSDLAAVTQLVTRAEALPALQLVADNARRLAANITYDGMVQRVAAQLHAYWATAALRTQPL